MLTSSFLVSCFLCELLFQVWCQMLSSALFCDVVYLHFDLLKLVYWFCLGIDKGGVCKRNVLLSYSSTKLQVLVCVFCVVFKCLKSGLQRIMKLCIWWGRRRVEGESGNWRTGRPDPTTGRPDWWNKSIQWRSIFGTEVFAGPVDRTLPPVDRTMKDCYSSKHALLSKGI